MRKSFHSMADSQKQKTLFFKSASLMLTLAMLVSAIFAPGVSADEAAADGYTTKNTTVYSSIEAVGASGIADSNKTSRWKFAVSTTSQNDFFAVTTNDFNIDANANENGGVTITWTAPTGVTGEATVKISDGATYNRSFTATGSSYTSTEFAVGSTYEIQVIIGENASEVFSYGNTMLPATVQNYSGNTNFSSGNGVVFTNFLIGLGENKKYVTSNAGLLIKLDMSFLEGKEVYFNYAATKGDYVGKTYSSHKAWLAFSSNLNPITQDEVNGNWTSLSNSTGDAVQGTNNAYIIDTGKGIYQAINHPNGKVIQDGDMNYTASGGKQYTDENTSGFTEGYLLIPFDHYNADMLSKIAGNGYLRYTTENYNYYYYTQSNATEKAMDKNPHLINTSDLVDGYTIENVGENKSIRSLFDREISIGGVTLITDYAGFVSANLDTENKSFSAGNAKSETTITNGGYMTATGNNLSSRDGETTGKYTDYNSGYSFTVASGEIAKIGFTAPTEGYYEISDKLTAQSTAGANYRVVLEAENGNRTLLQSARDVSTNGKTVLLAKLGAGDTVYIEAWASTANAEIGFGIPKAVKINNMTSGAYTSTPIDYFVNKGNDGVSYREGARIQQQAAWQFKWFLNPVSVTDSTGTTVYTEEKYLSGEGITTSVKDNFKTASNVDYDTLGIADLEADSDGSKLINALRDYEETYGGWAYISKISAISGIKDDGTLLYNRATRNHLVSGFLSLVETNANGTAGNAKDVASGDAYSFSYQIGFGRGVANTAFYYFNMGVAFEWTAPASGTVDVSGMSREQKCSQIILVNNVVKAALHNDNKTAIDALEVKKGDVVTIAYDTVGDKPENSKQRGIPSITFTPNVANVVVTDDTVDCELVGGLLEVGAEITLPEFVKRGTLFRYWRDASEATYTAEEAYTVSDDDTLTPVYSYYGDLDGDDKVAAADLTTLRKCLMLGFENVLKDTESYTYDEIQLLADVNDDGEYDLLDLIRMKKYLAGYNVFLGE